MEQGWRPLQGQVPSLWTSPRGNRLLLFLPAPEPSDVLRDEPTHLKKTSCFQRELPSVRCSHQGRWWQHQDHSPPSGETGGCLKAVSSMAQPRLTARQFRNGTRGRGPLGPGISVSLLLPFPQPHMQLTACQDPSHLSPGLPSQQAPESF